MLQQHASAKTMHRLKTDVTTTISDYPDISIKGMSGSTLVLFLHYNYLFSPCRRSEEPEVHKRPILRHHHPNKVMQRRH